MYWQGALSDITDRKASENAYKQSERRSRLMIESVTDHATVMLEPAGTIADLELDSAPGKGTTVRLRVPVGAELATRESA